MSSPRADMPSMLFVIVHEDIKNNKIRRSTLVAESRDKILKGTANRVFDNLPRIIDEEVLAILANRYLAIVRDARFSGEENVEPNIATQKNMKSWMKGLIGEGIAELFDGQGKLKENIVDLFGWGDLVDRIDKKKLVSAYVGAVMADMMQRHEVYINERLGDNNALISNYINNHYSQWIEEMMNEKKLQSTVELTPAKVLTVAGAGLFFGVIGVVATVGFFAATASASSVEDRPDYAGPKL